MLVCLRVTIATIQSESERLGSVRQQRDGGRGELVSLKGQTNMQQPCLMVQIGNFISSDEI